MTEEVERAEGRLAWLVSLILVVAVGVRIGAAVVAGFVEWNDPESAFAGTGRARAYDVLSTFGAAGDGTGVVLLLAAAVLVWFAARLDDGRAPTLWPVLGWLFAGTAALAVMQGIGSGLVYTLPPGHQTARLIETEGFALATVLICVCGVVVVQRLGRIIDDRVLAYDDLDAFVFAVDRKSGEVRAFLSPHEASRRMHLYSVEDDEFAFYTDEGVVLEATVVDDRIVLRPTERQHPAELLESLKEFANRRGIKVDEDDADDATAYALPISRWHWLEMWPPWMRPIGMLFRRR